MSGSLRGNGLHKQTTICGWVDNIGTADEQQRRRGVIRLLSGDCRDVLATLPAESVQCCVTSPPYYGLRDYGTALWDGGEAGCDHRQHIPQGAASSSTLRPEGKPHHHLANADVSGLPYRDTCGKCGAVRVDRQIGLEASPEAYLATMVGVFREVRRVLRRDGTCWVNMGDSYASTPSGSFDKGGRGSGALEGGGFRSNKARSTVGYGAKPKDLLLMPARLALALQADGWWVRSDIIWKKPNPMPESCTDRPTSAHEHVFLLTKSGTPTGWTHRDGLAGMTSLPPPDYRWVHKDTKHEMDVMPGDWDTHEHVRKIWKRINLWRGHDYYYDADAVREAHDEPWRSTGRLEQMGTRVPDDDMARGSFLGKRAREYNPSGRSCRNVWTIATHAYSAAHFATFPPELAERCIKAGTSERGACAACGKARVRVTDRAFVPQGDVSLERGIKGAAGQKPMYHANGWDGVPRGTMSATTTGWQPACQCNAETVPCTVLDPFAGAGTTLLVADRLQRDAIGIELNTAYTEMAMERCRADAPLLADLGPMPEHPEESAMADLFAGDEYQQPKALTTPRRDGNRWNNHERGYGGFAPRTLPDMAAD